LLKKLELISRTLPSILQGQADAPPEALARYEQGRAHFREGRYREAIVELKAALALDPGSPNLIYNVAYASELLGDLTQAIRYYRQYLDALPASAEEDQSRTRETLKRLEGHQAQVAADAARRGGSLKTPQGSAAPPLGQADVLFWSALGSGVAMLAAGSVTGVMALERENEVADFVAGESRDGSLRARQRTIDQADNLALASDLLLAGGAALSIGAALLFFLREPERAHAKRIRPTLYGDGRGVLLQIHGAF
jgi:tetratricopeptide (TPR) repeat protein